MTLLLMRESKLGHGFLAKVNSRVCVDINETAMLVVLSSTLHTECWVDMFRRERPAEIFKVLLKDQDTSCFVSTGRPRSVLRNQLIN